MSVSWNKRKLITFFSIALIIVLLMGFFTFSVAYADDDYVSESEVIEVTSGGLMKMLNSVYKIEANGDGTISSRIGEIYNTDLVQGASDALKGIAGLIVFLILVIECIQELSRGDPTMEMYLKLFIKALLGLFMIEYLDQILNAVSNLGLSIVNSVATTSIDEYSNDASMIEDLKFPLKTAAKLLLWACKFSIIIPAWNNFFEIMVRRMFAPLAIADTWGEGMHSPGVRYLRTYLGVFVRIGLSYVIVALMGAFLNSLTSITNAPMFKFISMVGIIFGGVGLMSKGQSLIKEIMGG